MKKKQNLKTNFQLGNKYFILLVIIHKCGIVDEVYKTYYQKIKCVKNIFFSEFIQNSNIQIEILKLTILKRKFDSKISKFSTFTINF